MLFYTTPEGRRVVAFCNACCVVLAIAGSPALACMVIINCFPELRGAKPEPVWIPPELVALQERRGVSGQSPEVIMAEAVGTPTKPMRAAKAHPKRPKQTARAARPQLHQASLEVPEGERLGEPVVATAHLPPPAASAPLTTAALPSPLAKGQGE